MGFDMSRGGGYFRDFDATRYPLITEALVRKGYSDKTDLQDSRRELAAPLPRRASAGAGERTVSVRRACRPRGTDDGTCSSHWRSRRFHYSHALA